MKEFKSIKPGSSFKATKDGVERNFVRTYSEVKLTDCGFAGNAVEIGTGFVWKFKDEDECAAMRKSDE